LFDPELLSQALNTKGIILLSMGRNQEGIALLRHALRIALEHDAAEAALRAYNNLSSTLATESRHEEELELVEAGLLLARKMGNAGWEAKFLADRAALLCVVGRWDEAIRAAEEEGIDPAAARLPAMVMERTTLVIIHAARGDFEQARVELWEDLLSASEDIQAVTSLEMGRAWIHFYSGRYQEALEAGRRGLRTREKVGMTIQVEVSYAMAADAALAMEDLVQAREVLADMQAVPAGQSSPYFKAQVARLSADVAAREGDQEAARAGYQAAVASLRKLGVRFDLGVALAEQGLWLAGEGREEEARPSLTEAREIFEDLRATWWLDRIRGALEQATGQPEPQIAGA
jgi:tetratricopeptide (TPR) repeat protein